MRMLTGLTVRVSMVFKATVSLLLALEFATSHLGVTCSTCQNGIGVGMTTETDSQECPFNANLSAPGALMEVNRNGTRTRWVVLLGKSGVQASRNAPAERHRRPKVQIVLTERESFFDTRCTEWQSIMLSTTITPTAGTPLPH